ncbi:hypothetical protein AB6A40_010666 [Gnathostoma spinigerum]|uniref:EGF-like domain-containing protein n=1 Tax=Gnathostoma spinigerum TaxID=75299 RepID=A0ABD6F2V3_9BILA
MYLLYLLFLNIGITRSQTVTKDIIDFCDPRDPYSCGSSGVCMARKTGNRCRCPEGYMGKACQRMSSLSKFHS